MINWSPKLQLWRDFGEILESKASALAT